MKSIGGLPIRNIIKRPARSVALMIIAAFLAFSAFGGTLMVMSLSNGLDSLSMRLGADIVVVPYSATSKVSYDSVIIQGIHEGIQLAQMIILRAIVSIFQT